MNFISKEDYEKAIKKVKEYEERENKISRFKTELGQRLKEFNKFTFKIKNNSVIFAGYFIDKNDNDHIKIGYSICSEDDIFNKLLGKLIAVRKALGLKIDDIVEVVEPVKKRGNIITAIDSNGIKIFRPQIAGYNICK